MGNVGARSFGLEEAPTTLQDSSKNTAHIVKFPKSSAKPNTSANAFKVDSATKEEHSEKFFNETIEQIHPW
jgi:norsolorinic acid ketoreductase